MFNFLQTLNPDSSDDGPKVRKEKWKSRQNHKQDNEKDSKRSAQQSVISTPKY
jgi:hypothetical protein